MGGKKARKTRAAARRGGRPLCAPGPQPDSDAPMQPNARSEACLVHRFAAKRLVVALGGECNRINS